MNLKKVATLCLVGCAVMIALTLLRVVHAQISLTTLGTEQKIDFNTFAGAGAKPTSVFLPTPTMYYGMLDTLVFSIGGMSDGYLPLGGTAFSGDFARGITSGGVITGGMYAFDLGSGNRSLGFQPTDSDMTPGSVMARIDNNTGEQLTALEVSYDIVVYNDGNRSSRWSFYWGSGGSGTFIKVDDLEVTTKLAADPAPGYTETRCAALLYNFSIAPGGSMYLLWETDDVAGSGARDESGIDNISVRGLQLVFLDGFESGGTTAWSSAVP